MRQVQAAIDGPWELLGRVIVDAGQEDASGFRRMLAEDLRNRNYEPFERLGVSRERFESIRKVFVDAYGEPK